MKMTQLLKTAMSSLGVELLFLLALTSYLGIVESILCVRCDSNDDKAWDKKCELEPPKPFACTGSTNTQKYCGIIRHYRKDASLLRLIRGCVTTEQDNCTLTGSEEDTHPYRVCYWTCTTDGCNAASQTAQSTSLQLLCGLTLAVCLTTL